MNRKSISGTLVLGGLAAALIGCPSSPPVRDDESYQNWRKTVITTDTVAFTHSGTPVTYGGLGAYFHDGVMPKMAALQEQIGSLEGLTGVVEGRQVFQTQYDRVVTEWTQLQEQVQVALRSVDEVEQNYATNTELANETLGQYKDLIGAPIDNLGGGVRALNDRQSSELELQVQIYRITAGFLVYQRQQQEILGRNTSQALAPYLALMATDAPLADKRAAWNTAEQAREAARAQLQSALVHRINADSRELTPLFERLLRLSAEGRADREALLDVTRRHNGEADTPGGQR